MIVATILLLKLLGLVLLLRAETTVAVTVSIFLMGFAGGSLLPMHPYLTEAQAHRVCDAFARALA